MILFNLGLYCFEFYQIDGLECEGSRSEICSLLVVIYVAAVLFLMALLLLNWLMKHAILLIALLKTVSNMDNVTKTMQHEQTDIDSDLFNSSFIQVQSFFLILYWSTTILVGKLRIKWITENITIVRVLEL